MSIHTYPVTAVLGDYIRTVLGLAISIVPFFVAPAKPLITLVFAGMVAAFVVYGLRTLSRQLTRIEVSDAGIRTNMPSARAIAWDEVERLRLQYFAAKRNRTNGWFQLLLSGAGRTIAIESSIRDFHAVVTQAADAAARNRLELDDATASNLAALVPSARPATA